MYVLIYVLYTYIYLCKYKYMNIYKYTYVNIYVFLLYLLVCLHFFLLSTLSSLKERYYTSLTLEEQGLWSLPLKVACLHIFF